MFVMSTHTHTYIYIYMYIWIIGILELLLLFVLLCSIVIAWKHYYPWIYELLEQRETLNLSPNLSPTMEQNVQEVATIPRIEPEEHHDN